MQGALAEQGLKPNAAKTSIKPISAGLTFLGMVFDDTGNTNNDDLPLPNHKPLYVTEMGAYLGLSGEALEVRLQGKLLLTRPLARVSEVVLLVPVSLSSVLLARLQHLGISVTLGHSGGRHLGCIAPDSRAFLARSHRHAQRFEATADDIKLAMAREIAATKVRNQMALLKQRFEAGDTPLLEQLAALANKIDAAASVDSVRGFEGQAAQKFFARLSASIQDSNFAWRKRLKGHGQAPDRINALLNFGYFLLYSRLNAEIRGQGLNPYLGFLHETPDRFETLVADLQELFRPHVDRLVVRLINLKVIRAEHFADLQERGMRLSREGTQLFVQHFQRELHRKPKNQGLSLADALTAQVLSLRNWACNDGNLVLFQLGTHG